MLAAEHRLRRSEDFSRTVRRGRRASRRLLTVHLLLPGGPATGAGRSAPAPGSGVTVAEPAGSGTGPVDGAGLVDRHGRAASRAGLVVSKAVGGSVVRHRTARRLRHLLRDRVAGLPAGSLLVVRAAAPAGVADSSALAADLDAALAAALRRPAGRRPSGDDRSGAIPPPSGTGAAR